MRIEWDERKARANLRRHGVSFHEAATIFFDVLSRTGDDPDHSHIGVCYRGAILAGGARSPIDAFNPPMKRTGYAGRLSPGR